MYISQNDDGIRAERFIEKTFPQIPRGMRHKFFRTKKIAFFRKGKRLKLEKSLILHNNDEVRLFFDPKEFGEKKQKKSSPKNWSAILRHPRLSRITVAWEDEYMMIIEKPAGVAVHPGTGVQFGHSAIDYATALICSKNADAPIPKLVHRLDKDTSGLLMIAKCDSFLRKMTHLLANKKITKKYVALVQGKMEQEKGTISEKIQRKEGSRYSKMSTNSGKGKDSVTHYSVVRYNPITNISKLAITLETGRMHQIRIHFASHNHPLAGDQVYGNFSWNKELQKKFGLKHQALHACSITFTHPQTNNNVTVTSPLPQYINTMV